MSSPDEPAAIPESFFRDLCENARDMIQSVDTDGRFLYVNRAWRETLGYGEAEVRRLRVMDVIHPECREHCAQQFQQLMRGVPVVLVQTDFVSSRGARVPVEGTASCRAEDGRVVSTRGIFRDLRERRQSERELARLFAMASDLLCVANVEGFFTRVNPSFRRVLGYDDDQLLGRTFLDLVHPDDRDRTLDELAAIADGRAAVDFENRYRTAAGDYRWLAWRSSPAMDEGRIYAIARDVTSMKAKEELLGQQAAELQRSNEELERFAYVVSHDLQAPLRAIRNLATWVDEELPADTGAEARQHLAELRRRAEGLDGLITRLLEYSRADRRAAATVATVDVEALVHEIVALLSPAAGMTVACGDLPTLMTARSPLEQVLRNLIGNALLHHDRDRGTVTVSSRRVGDEWEVSVRDDGPGIPTEDQESVFRMFERGGSSAGTGLGLHLVKRTVEAHGGKVWIAPHEGRGTDIRFTWREGDNTRPEDQTS